MKKFPLPFHLLVGILRGTLFLSAGLLLQSQAIEAGGFEPTGSLNTARYYHTATPLGGGVVLVAGGLETTGGFPLASAELYDSATGTWTDTGSLTTERFLHRATLLSNGTVLVAGGLDGNFNASPSAEVYDLAVGKWTATGSLNIARSQFRLTLLTDGMVLVTGGLDVNGKPLASAELYDPASGTWTSTGSLNIGRYNHTATRLASGMVLVAGGLNNAGAPSSSAELYDPALGEWTLTGDLNNARDLHTATALGNGKVLVAGGTDGNFNVTASAELYDPVLGTWADTGNLNTAREFHTATLLSGGMVLVAGGADSTGAPSATAELFAPALGTWSDTGILTTARQNHTATLLPGGMVLIAGGFDGNANVTGTAELYDPALQPPVIVSPLVATGTVSLSFSYQFETTGATTLAVSGLPSGLSFDPTLRAIVGVPDMTGRFQIGLSASNAAGTTNENLVVTVQSFPASGPVIISVTSAKGRTGSPFSFQVITSGGSPLTRLAADGSPAGLTADPITGEISGTVTADGSFVVTLSATDFGFTNSATLQLTFVSDPATPVIVSSNSADLFPQLPFSFTIMAPSSDTSDQVIYSVVGQLPPGLGLPDQTTGVISGTPNLGRSSLQPSPLLSGGVVSNVQLFACNSSGCGAQGLFFLLPTGAANISTRLSVGTGDDVLIGGFITQGNAPMNLVVRGIGASLPVTGVLANPFLELHNGPMTIASNDNWKDNLAGGSQELAIQNTGLAPTNDLESAILAVLDAGAYTAIMRGTNNGTGVGLVEVYNLGAASMDVSSEAHLANISTRGNVQTADNVMIGGFINQGSVPIKVLVRGIGPSLGSAGVSGALANPVLELHQADGSVVTNNDWKATQEAEITATGLAPNNDLESAILVTLPVGQGAYTAIVSGANGTTGIGLVEAYFGNPCLGTSCP